MPSTPRCPKCGRSPARRTHREGVTERLLSLLYVYPFRCQVCGRRFLKLQWGVRYARISADLREFERIPVRVTAVIHDGRTHLQGETINLALDGCAIEGQAPFLPDTSVRVELRLPRGGRPVEVASAVVRASREGAVGLHFVRMDADSRQRLRQFMLDRQGQTPRPHSAGWAGALGLRLSMTLWLAGLIVLILVILVLTLGPHFSICTWGVNC
jgi:hypothetical protein